MSDSLLPHEPQHTRPPCPSPTPRVYPNSCSLSGWCNLTISSFVAPFSSCLQSFPTSGSFQMRQIFASGGQNIEVSASISPNCNLPGSSVHGIFQARILECVQALNIALSSTAIYRCNVYCSIPQEYTGHSRLLTISSVKVFTYWTYRVLFLF